MKNRIIKSGFSFAEIMVVIAIVAVLAAIAIPSMRAARLNANESAARSMLQTIANAYGSYAANNNGNYPVVEADLLPPPTGTANPSYLNCPADLAVCAYDGQTINGYAYSLPFGQTLTLSDVVTATPSSCNSTGSMVYSIIVINGTWNNSAC